MKHFNQSKVKHEAVLILLLIFLVVPLSFAQQSSSSELEKMPVDLETDFALSALPSHLREGATVYLLDPKKGYYKARQGDNPFTCFVSRTEWEWNEFRNDNAYAVCYDVEGTRTIIPVYLDVAQMRASGKYTPAQVRDIVVERIKKGAYKAPAKPGISYMLAPVMRTYPNAKTIVTVNLPHYMFYAPYLTDTDIGGEPGTQSPGIFNPGDGVLGAGKSPFNYIVLPAGAAETAKILEENKELLKRLIDYKSWFKPEGRSDHH